VVAGFQGASHDGETTTLGRGGSDTSACAIGAALNADVVEIYTDVDGVLSADPRVCPGARVLDRLQYEELFQMALTGAKVMHAPAAEIAMGADVPVRVLNTDGSSSGTLIAGAGLAGGLAPRVATAISHSTGVARFVVALPEDARGRAATVTRVFRLMADAGVSLDMFTPLGGVLAFSADGGAIRIAGSLLDGAALPFTCDDRLAKVTLVGAGMHGIPGVMARISEALSSGGIDILQVADSHYTISVLVRESDLARAVGSLHAEFELGVE
jgi:aspartate kinase